MIAEAEWTKILGDQLIARTVKVVVIKKACSHEARDDRIDASLYTFFLTACMPHRFLVATLSSDHGHQLPTTRGAGWYPLLTECSHRCPQSREGGLERHTSKGCVRFYQ